MALLGVAFAVLAGTTVLWLGAAVTGRRRARPPRPEWRTIRLAFSFQGIRLVSKSDGRWWAVAGSVMVVLAMLWTVWFSFEFQLLSLRLNY